MGYLENAVLIIIVFDHVMSTCHDMAILAQFHIIRFCIRTFGLSEVSEKLPGSVELSFGEIPGEIGSWKVENGSQCVSD